MDYSVFLRCVHFAQSLAGMTIVHILSLLLIVGCGKINYRIPVGNEVWICESRDFLDRSIYRNCFEKTSHIIATYIEIKQVPVVVSEM